MPSAGVRGGLVHQIVPKASGVANALHRMVPEQLPASESADGPASPALSCPHSSGPCPALTSLFSSLAPSGEDAHAWLRSLAPCAHCRVSFEAGRDGLRHVRLGQREREILIAAAEGPLILTAPGMSRSLSAARRRAALSLGKAGLVAPPGGGGAAGPGPRRATVVLTELGRYVMTAYGRYIVAGKPVRWTRPARGAGLPGCAPSELAGEALQRTEAALRDTLAELKSVLVAAIGGRLKDPARLDAVTLHLERKATLLKAVLQPVRGNPG